MTGASQVRGGLPGGRVHGGEIVVQCLLCCSVIVKSQDLAEKGKASLFYLAYDGRFFGDVVEFVVGFVGYLVLRVILRSMR